MPKQATKPEQVRGGLFTQNGQPILCISKAPGQHELPEGALDFIVKGVMQSCCFVTDDPTFPFAMDRSGRMHLAHFPVDRSAATRVHDMEGKLREIVDHAFIRAAEEHPRSKDASAPTATLVAAA